MGKRGPAPTPTALRLLKGGHPERVNRREPKPTPTPIEAPEYLDDDARAIWDRLVPDLVTKAGLSHWDVPALAVLCTAVVHHRRAVELVNSTGILIKPGGGHGGVVKHPAMQIIRDQAAIIRAYAQEFGLTPSARSELLRTGEPTGSPADRLLS